MNNPNNFNTIKPLTEATTFALAGVATGASLATTIGGMGLVGGFGGVAVGSVPITLTGGVVGVAVYGGKQAIQQSDSSVILPLVGGAIAGVGVANIVGGMGLAVGGTAVSIGVVPVATAGAILGLAGYGFQQMIEHYSTVKNSPAKQWEYAISRKLNEDLGAAKKAKLEADQAKRDEFWKQRDAEFKQNKLNRVGAGSAEIYVSHN
ncbi:MAG: hypothetical protein KA714_14295 [Limnoraphis sp. WC205]|jgi:hypothetical protein|nr:hypothetical protein [Limnoraphis sp. WC205]